MSGTYTLAEIHERHERLERIAAGINAAKLAPEAISIAISPQLPEAHDDDFYARLSAEVGQVLPELLDSMAADLVRHRAQLKTDATAAFVAFMGGE